MSTKRRGYELIDLEKLTKVISKIYFVQSSIILSGLLSIFNKNSISKRIGHNYQRIQIRNLQYDIISVLRYQISIVCITNNIQPLIFWMNHHISWQASRFALKNAHNNQIASDAYRCTVDWSFHLNIHSEATAHTPEVWLYLKTPASHKKAEITSMNQANCLRNSPKHMKIPENRNRKSIHSNGQAKYTSSKT